MAWVLLHQLKTAAGMKQAVVWLSGIAGQLLRKSLINVFVFAGASSCGTWPQSGIVLSVALPSAARSFSARLLSLGGRIGSSSPQRIKVSVLVAAGIEDVSN